jgi:hypothetical protein
MAFADRKRRNGSKPGYESSDTANTPYFESTFNEGNLKSVPDGEYTVTGIYLEPTSKKILEDQRTGKRYSATLMHLLLEGKDGDVYNLIEVVNNEFRALFKEASLEALNKKLNIKNGLITGDSIYDLAPWSGTESIYAAESFPTRNLIRLSEALGLEKFIILSPSMAYTVNQVKKERPNPSSNSNVIIIEADLTGRQLRPYSTEDAENSKEILCKFVVYIPANCIQNYEKAERVGSFLTALRGKEFTPLYSLPTICHSPNTSELMECIGKSIGPTFKKGQLYRLDNVEKEGEQKVILHAAEIQNNDVVNGQTPHKKDADRPKIEVGFPTILKDPSVKFEIHTYNGSLINEEWFGPRSQGRVFNHFKKYIDAASKNENKFASLMVERDIYPGEVNFMDVGLNEGKRHISDIFMLNVVDCGDINIRRITGNISEKNVNKGLLR